MVRRNSQFNKLNSIYQGKEESWYIFIKIKNSYRVV